MRLRVQVDGVEFWGLTDYGFQLTPDGFTGWDASTPTKRQVVPLPLAHGSFGQPGYRDTRVVTLSGYCLAESGSKLGWYRSQLMGLLADGDAGQITVEHAGVTKFAACYLDGQPQFDVIAAGAAATFQIQFWFPDPRIFGDTQSVTGTSVTVFHYGNFPADPVVTVAGPRVGGYTITGPGGATFTVTQDPGAGHVHTVDFATGLVSLDGVVQSGVVASADTWTIPPGQQVVMSISSGSMTVAVKDTFI